LSKLEGSLAALQLKNRTVAVAKFCMNKMRKMVLNKLWKMGTTILTLRNPTGMKEKLGLL
jgi:hypothetical protein